MNANLYKNIMTQLKFVFNQNNWRIILFNFDKHLHREQYFNKFKVFLSKFFFYFIELLFQSTV
jgi:hypothetical protein